MTLGAARGEIEKMPMCPSFWISKGSRSPLSLNLVVT